MKKHSTQLSMNKDQWLVANYYTHMINEATRTLNLLTANTSTVNAGTVNILCEDIRRATTTIDHILWSYR